MTVSIEALAMAGTDYNEWDLDIETWEDDDDDPHCPPPHLLAGEKEEEAARFLKEGTQIISTGSPTRPSEDFNAIDEARGECMHRGAFRGKTLIERIIQSSSSIKMIKYMIMPLMIAVIVGRNRFLKPY